MQQPPGAWAAPPARPDPTHKIAIGCIGAGCLTFAGIVALVCLFAFLDHYGYINDSILKTVRRCRTFGC